MQEYCTLDPVSRKLTLTEPQRIAGVESDENVRGLKFKFPKAVEGADFTQMQLRINYINSRQEKGQYIVTDLKPVEGEEDYITFTWPFSRLVTHYRGLTKFVICAVKTDENGTITAEWNTALAQMRVLEGLEVDGPEISPEEKDIIAQLISICQNSADKAAQSAKQAQEEAEKVLTYGPEIGENGNWYLKGQDTGKPSRGEPGPKGEPGDAGEKGDPGKPGANGETPIIGDNSNWFIGGVDTGKPSRGEKGDKGEIGTAGEDGITPTIGANGNWFLGQEDTGKPSRGESGEILLAEYIHQGNQEIYFSSFDWETGTGECTKPHGLTQTTMIMIVPNDWWQGDFSEAGLSIPVEWCMYSNDLYVSVVDENHLKVVGAKKNSIDYEDIPVNDKDSYNVNLDCTQFHLEIGVPFEITNFPVKPTSIRTTISGFITGGLTYRYLLTDMVMGDGTKTTAQYTPGNALYAIPDFGTFSKPKHAIYQIIDMVTDLNGSAFVPFYIKCKFFGRRRSLISQFIGEIGSENLINTHTFNPNYPPLHQGYKYIYSLKSSSAWPIYSNHSAVKVYAKAVTQ